MVCVQSERGWFNPERPFLLSVENPLDEGTPGRLLLWFVFVFVFCVSFVVVACTHAFAPLYGRPLLLLRASLCPALACIQ